MTTTLSRPTKQRSKIDPRWFAEHVLGSRIYQKQVEIVEAVRDGTRVACVGANGTGKDFCTGAVVIPWWMSIYSPAKVVVIGPTHRQVHDIVWSETRRSYYNRRGPLDGVMYRTSRWEISDDHFATGFATVDSYNIQGYHSPHLLVIVTEAHNVSQSHFDAIMRLNPQCLLMTGNPLSDGGYFFEAFHARMHQWQTINISAFDAIEGQRELGPTSGLVTEQDVEDRKEEYGEESPLYIAGVLGQFPDNLEDAVVPRSMLLAARERVLPPLDDDRAVLACDVARFGEDSTVVYRRQGHQSVLVWRSHGRDTQYIAGKLKELAEDDETVDTIVVDDNGVGGGVTDRLREEQPRGGTVRIVPFNGGASANRDTRYANAVTEAWYSIREAALEGMLDIDNNPALIGQLSSRRIKYLGSGRVQLESKEDYKKRAGQSPDDADALAMCYSPLVRRTAPRMVFAGR